MENHGNEAVQFRQGSPRQPRNVPDDPLRRLRIGHPARNEIATTVRIGDHKHRLATMRPMDQHPGSLPAERMEAIKDLDRLTRNVGFVRGSR